MTVVSVINYKGGVGKTTVTANIGAELAYRGHRVLLIDLDPQASLTFSFVEPTMWERELADERTILQWFGDVLDRGGAAPLDRYLLTPPTVNEVIGQHSEGRLDLVPSHLMLTDADLDFAASLGGSRFQHGSPRFLSLHRALAEALAAPAFTDYQVVLVDCPPNFTMVTRTGVVASDHILIPARPDYLSTLGIDYLRKKVSELVTDYNRVAAGRADQISPEILGIVFTMVQYTGHGPLLALRNFIGHPATIEIPRFQQMIRDNKTVFASAGEHGLPAVLMPDANVNVQYELQQLASEFLAKIRP
ncbi:chromosome partitioning protein [Micromonospora sp. Llam0]|uniref:ParA family protein n=1 Tax=Micromonospora sp. Llam0 TaxID=2485143 RepID=UPI000F4617D6|nr:ParA family protein [Micromonospora sp. Llam0]ROO62512.1 chromosome partitioning protein [Micromonospora sp. Llam0]